jgi:hypothetical protein
MRQQLANLQHFIVQGQLNQFGLRQQQRATGRWQRCDQAVGQG